MPRKIWSHSQTAVLRNCERKWFINYAMNAKINSQNSLLREIAFLKKLRPSYMWRGDLVHGIIAEVLKKAANSRILPLDAVIDALQKRAENQWIESKRRALHADPRTTASPAGSILMEHYYSFLNGGLELEQILRPAQQQLSNLYQWIQRQGIFDQVAQAQAWIEPPVYFPNAPGFMVGDVRFVTKVDLALRLPASFRIFDWKTSTEPKGEFNLSRDHRQASYYALWPHLEMNHPIESLEISVVYVGGAEPNMHSITLLPEDAEDLVADAELLVSSSRDFLEPKNGFQLEDFDWATSAKTCRWCSFQKICQRELE